MLQAALKKEKQTLSDYQNLATPAIVKDVVEALADKVRKEAEAFLSSGGGNERGNVTLADMVAACVEAWLDKAKGGAGAPSLIAFLERVVNVQEAGMSAEAELHRRKKWVAIDARSAVYCAPASVCVRSRFAFTGGRSAPAGACSPPPLIGKRWKFPPDLAAMLSARCGARAAALASLARVQLFSSFYPPENWHRGRLSKRIGTGFQFSLTLRRIGTRHPGFFKFVAAPPPPPPAPRCL